MTRDTKTPRTRRQLREALQRKRDELSALQHALRIAGVETRTEKTTYLGGYTECDTRVVDSGPKRYTQEDVDAIKEKCVAEARRETLQTVIEALQLREYGYRESGLRIVNKGPDEFFADLQAALKVREDRKHAETQAAIEKKVAGLTKKPFENTFSFTFVPTDGFDPFAPKVSDLHPEPKKKKPTTKKEAKK